MKNNWFLADVLNGCVKVKLSRVRVQTLNALERIIELYFALISSSEIKINNN